MNANENCRMPMLLLFGMVFQAQGFTRHVSISNKSSKPTNLFGLSNVNDYFNSFGNAGGTDGKEGDELSQSSTYANVNDYFNTLSNKDGSMQQQSQGTGQKSAYANINDYFNSFNEPKEVVNIDEAEKWHGNDNFGLNNYGTNQDQQLQEPEQITVTSNPTEHMTPAQIEEYNNARLCPKMLLTQSAIQSFCYLLEECRDPHSGKWIEDYLQVGGLKNYHGCGAFNITRYPTWDSLLLDLIRQPNEKMIVSAKRRGRGHGGWSKNNPYLNERWVEYPIDINPASLVQRLLPVRNQLAKEFERDLDIVQMVDGMIMDSYFNRINTDSADDSTNQPAFDRISVNILNNFTEFQEGAPSPLRRGNFDLLYSLCTHASAHELLRELKADSRDEITFEWFKTFYEQNVSKYFDGDQSFGRADDFIDALLRRPPSFVETRRNSIGLIDPMALAERIIGIRSQIAEEWKYVMQEVEDDHAWLNDKLIRAMMGKAIDNTRDEVDARVEIVEEKIWDIPDDIGAFE